MNVLLNVSLLKYTSFLGKKKNVCSVFDYFMALVLQ